MNLYSIERGSLGFDVRHGLVGTCLALCLNSQFLQLAAATQGELIALRCGCICGWTNHGGSPGLPHSLASAGWDNVYAGPRGSKSHLYGSAVGRGP